MRLASVTSCSAVRSGTLPISLRYMRTGSKLPPSLCVTRAAAARTAASSASAFVVVAAARDAGTRTRRATRPVLGARRAPARRAARRAVRGATRAPLVFELELFGDLVEHLDAARLEHLPQLAQLVVSGSRSGNAAKISPVVMKPRSRTCVEHADGRRRSVRAGDARGRGAFTVFGLSRLGHRHHVIRAAPPSR